MLISFILIIFIIGSISATLESAVFGFGKDMAMSSISSQNPALGQVISFAMCPQCAVTSSALTAVEKVIPGASQIYGFVNNPEGAALSVAKQKMLSELKKDLSPKERIVIDNFQNIQPYIKEAFKVNPEAPEGQQKGTIEIDEDGNTIIIDPEGNIFAKIPENFEVIEDENAFVLVNKGDTNENEVEIKGYKFNIEKDTKISFSEKEGITSLSLEGSGSININGTTLNNIKDATIRIDNNNQIEFAEFISTKKEDYKFTYNNEEFIFNTNENSHVIFDPKSNKITGKNVKLNYKNQNFEGSKINVLLEDGDIKEVKISGNGIYEEDNMIYSSKDDFSVYFDGTDVSDKENALSVLKEGYKVQVESKGRIKIENGNGLTYEGLDKNAYTKYRAWDSVFDVQDGNAIINNGVHEVKLENGRIFLSIKNLEKDSEAESFTFKYKKGSDIEDLSYTKINEESGNIEVLSIIDGKEKSTVLYSFKEFEEKKQVFPKNTPKEKFEEELNNLNNEIDLRKEQGKDVSGLVKKRDVIGLALVDAKLKKSFENDDYDGAIETLEEYIKNVESSEIKTNAELTLGEIYQARANNIRDTLNDNKYRKGTQIWKKINKGGELLIVDRVEGDKVYYKRAAYDKLESMPKKDFENENYVFAKYLEGEDTGRGELKSVVLNKNRDGFDYYVEGRGVLNEEDLSGVKDYYEEAVRFYESAKKDSDLFDEASLSLAGMHNQFGNYKQAEDEYFNLIKNENEKIKSKAYMGLASTYISNQDPRKALQALDNAAKYNSENELAISSKRELESAFLDTISSSIDTEKTEVIKLWEEEIGKDKEWYNANLHKETMNIFGGYYENVEIIKSGSISKLDLQQKGIIAIKKLHSTGYNLEQIQEYFGEVGSFDESNRNKIVRAFNLPIDSKNEAEAKAAFHTSSEIVVAINRAFENPDIKNLASGGRSGKFNFETGEGYIDKSFYEKNWQDDIADNVFTPKNLALWVVPVVPVKGVTLIGWAGKGIKGATGISLSGAKTTLGATRLGQILSKEYTSPILPKTANAVMGIGSSEGIETSVGFFAEKVAPGSGHFVEILTGHSRISDLSKSAFKKGVDLPKTDKIFLLEGEEVVQSLTFSSRKQLSEFMKNTKGVEELGNNLYEYKGTKFATLLEDELPSSIGSSEILSTSTYDEAYLSVTLRLEGINKNNPSSLFYKISPSEKRTLEKLVEESPKPITQTNDELYNLDKDTYLESTINLGGVEKKVTIISTRRYKEQVKRLNELSEKFGGIEISGGNKVIKEGDIWRLEDMKIPDEDKILAFNSNMNTAGEIQLNAENLDKMIHYEILNNLAKDTGDSDIITLVSQGRYTDLDSSKKSILFQKLDSKINNGKYQLLASKKGVQESDDFKVLLEEEGFSSGTTHNHPEINENAKRPSIKDVLTSNKGNVEVVVTKTSGAHTFIPDDNLENYYNKFLNKIKNDPKTARSLILYKIKAISEDREIWTGPKDEAISNLRNLIKKFDTNPKDYRIDLENTATLLYEHSNSLDFYPSIIGTKMIKEQGGLSKAYPQYMEFLNSNKKELNIPSKAYLKEQTIQDFDESNFLCCSKDIIKGTNYCGQCGTKLK